MMYTKTMIKPCEMKSWRSLYTLKWISSNRPDIMNKLLDIYRGEVFYINLPSYALSGCNFYFCKNEVIIVEGMSQEQIKKIQSCYGEVDV